MTGLEALRAVRDREHLRVVLVAALSAHQRREGGGGCHCGAVPLGASYPQHVADVVLDVLEDAAP